MEPNPYLDCLIWLNSFELSWTRYRLTGGTPQPSVETESAKELVAHIKALAEQHPELLGPEPIKYIEGRPIDIVDAIAGFAPEHAKPPNSDSPYGVQNLDNYLHYLRTFLHQRLGIRFSTPRTHILGDWDFSREVVRWRSHLHHSIVMNPTGLLATLPGCLNGHDTIAVAGDIRRSQDLMTYSPTPELFAGRMVSFVNHMRQSVLDNGGFFDKFTGDGFIAFFNEEVSKRLNKSPIDGFLGFVRDASALAETWFHQWTAEVKKLPCVDVGLALGADIGRVRFLEQGGVLMAVGDAIVWAARMASAATAAQTLVNNLLYQALRNDATLDFTPVCARTKSGEDFLARAMTLRTATADSGAAGQVIPTGKLGGVS